MTAWRSSRFLPVTRSWSPWVWDDTPFRLRSFTNRLIRLAWSEEVEMPAWIPRRWRAVPLDASSTLPTSNLRGLAARGRQRSQHHEVALAVDADEGHDEARRGLRGLAGPRVRGHRHDYRAVRVRMFGDDALQSLGEQENPIVGHEAGPGQRQLNDHGADLVAREAHLEERAVMDAATLLGSVLGQRLRELQHGGLLEWHGDHLPRHPANDRAGGLRDRRRREGLHWPLAPLAQKPRTRLEDELPLVGARRRDQDRAVPACAAPTGRNAFGSCHALWPGGNVRLEDNSG